MKTLLAVLAAVVSFGISPVLRADAQVTADDTLFAGLAATDVTPPIGVPLAGYGGGGRRIFPIPGKYKYAEFLHPSEGVMDAIRAKVLMLQKGSEHLLFISVDVVGVASSLKDDLKPVWGPLGIKENEVFISATHTHSGPGNMSQNLIWELLAMDHFKKAIYRGFLAGISDAIMQAYAAMQPAEILTTSFEATGISKNRLHIGGAVDTIANLLLVRSNATGQWLGSLANFAIHGTAMGMSNFLFSADVPGGIERNLQTTLENLNGANSGPTTVLFVNGAEGDVSPATGGPTGIESIGQTFAADAAAAIPNARIVKPTWKITTAPVKLGSADLNVGACMTSHTVIAKILRAVHVFLGFWFPRKTQVSLLRLDDMAIMTWPGEPTTAFGFDLKDAATKAGARVPWVFGVTDDYLAYFTTPDEFAQGSAEACSSLYGTYGGQKIANAHYELLKHFND